MIFNGIEKPYIRVNIDLFRPPTPPIEFFTKAKTSGGSIVRKKRLRDFILPVPITVIGNPTVEHLKEDMSEWLMHDEPKKLIFKDRPNRYYLAEFESMNLDERKFRAKGIINFYLAEAYRFGESKQITLTTSNQTHQITGQSETPWELEVAFTAATDVFEFWCGDNYVRLNYQFITGDKLKLSYEGRKALLNGNDIRSAMAMISNFEELHPGSISVRASHNCVLKYDERYY